MPQEFRAYVSETRDATQRFDDASYELYESSRSTEGPKSAEFTLRSYGPCPWPPSKLLHEEVVVFDRNQIVDFLQRITKALSDHEDDHNFCESNGKALEEGRELLNRLSK